MRTRDLTLGAFLVVALPAAAVEPVFTDVTEEAGIAGLGITLTESVAWGDYDNDGWIDLYTGNRSSQRSNVYLNRGGRFVDVAAAAGVTAAGLGMGVLALDIDNDLDLDLYWTTWPSANRDDDSARKTTTDWSSASASTRARGVLIVAGRRFVLEPPQAP